MGTNRWSDYVRAVAPRGERQEDIAAAIGVKQATISRWLSGKTVPDEAGPVAAFAKAYGREVLEAFVAAGLLTEQDAGRGLTASARAFLADLPASGRDAAYSSFRNNERLQAALDERGQGRPRPRPVEKVKKTRKKA